MLWMACTLGRLLGVRTYSEIGMVSLVRRWGIRLFWVGGEVDVDFYFLGVPGVEFGG